MMRKIDPSLLPEEPPLGAPPLGVERPAPVEAPLGEAHPPAVDDVEYLPVIEDDAGRTENIGGRVMSEAMMFRMGREALSLAEMAEKLRVGERWLMRVMSQHSWLAAAYESGLSVRDSDRVVEAEKAMDKLVRGYKLTKERMSKDGAVIPLVEEVGPSAAAVVKLLEARAPDRYGKGSSGAAVRKVSVEVVRGVSERLREAGLEGVRVEVSE